VRVVVVLALLWSLAAVALAAWVATYFVDREDPADCWCDLCEHRRERARLHHPAGGAQLHT
jgi:hypothetical protein